MVKHTENHYVPALKYPWLTRVYDPVVAFTTREKVFRKRLLEQVGINPDDRILDLGCGTGTFALMLKSQYPDARISGLDGDPDILIQARNKTATSGLDVVFDESMSYATPYPEGEFDRVVSSLFFHHLKSVDKIRTFKEVYRILKPGGELHVCDWGRPTYLVSKATFFGVRLLDGFDVTRDNVEGRLPSLIEDVGFEEINQRGHVETMLGTLDFISARKPMNLTEEEHR